MHDILIPRSLLRAADRFGGERMGDRQRGQPVIQGGRLVGLHTPTPSQKATMVLPALTDPHCHLDKCHTIGRLGPVAGNLHTAIAAQLRDKAH